MKRARDVTFSQLSTTAVDTAGTRAVGDRVTQRRGSAHTSRPVTTTRLRHRRRGCPRVGELLSAHAAPTVRAPSTPPPKGHSFERIARSSVSATTPRARPFIAPRAPPCGELGRLGLPSPPGLCSGLRPTGILSPTSPRPFTKETTIRAAWRARPDRYTYRDGRLRVLDPATG
jgi:hypothetical protein